MLLDSFIIARDHGRVAVVDWAPNFEFRVHPPLDTLNVRTQVLRVGPTGHTLRRVGIPLRRVGIPLPTLAKDGHTLAKGTRYAHPCQGCAKGGHSLGYRTWYPCQG
jgi:hypothetical protein